MTNWKTILCLGTILLGWASIALSAPPTDRQIDQWLRQLDDEDFAVREAATTELIKAGTRVIDPTVAAAQGKSLEATDRCLRILRELWQSDDRATAKAARTAIRKLAAAEHVNATAAARAVLREHELKIVRKLEENDIGASFDGVGRIESLTFDKAKKLSDALDLLVDLQDVEVVHMSNRLVGDVEIAKLAVLRKLDYLNLFESGITDEALKHFKDMPALKSVPMGRTKVTDAGLVHLKELTRLEYVGLRGDAVSDAGLAHLENLTNLAGLHLGETKVTDAGLVRLKKMTKLRRLYLNDTAVTDAGLKDLECLESLEELFLANTNVTDAGVKKLRQARPGLQVIRE
jgi:hypothetical protein